MATTSSFTTLLSMFNPSRNSTARFPTRISAAYTSIERSASSASASASFYEILGIQSSATCLEIKQAYRKLARVSHPDVASSGADEFMRIHSAYATLSDPVKRADYDRSMHVDRRAVTASYGSARAGDATPFSRRRWETDQCW